MKKTVLALMISRSSGVLLSVKWRHRHSDQHRLATYIRSPSPLFTMSVLNVTGEEADPVKSFVFREVSEFCKKRRQDDLIDKEEIERQHREERLEKNKAWRMRRAERGTRNTEIKWDEEDKDIQQKRKRGCDIL